MSAASFSSVIWTGVFVFLATVVAVQNFWAPEISGSAVVVANSPVHYLHHVPPPGPLTPDRLGCSISFRGLGTVVVFERLGDKAGEVPAAGHLVSEHS